MSMPKYRGERAAIPQPGIRTRRGRAAFPLPRRLRNKPLFERVKPRANQHFRRECHGVARTFENLRRMRLPVVPGSY